MTTAGTSRPGCSGTGRGPSAWGRRSRRRYAAAAGIASAGSQMSGFAIPASLAAWAKVAGRNCIGPRAPAEFGAQPLRVAAVVGLDPPDRREHLPLEPEPRARLLVQHEVGGRDAGDIGRAVSTTGSPPTAQMPARRPRRTDDDREHEGRREPEAAARKREARRAAHPPAVRRACRPRAGPRAGVVSVGVFAPADTTAS